MMQPRLGLRGRLVAAVVALLVALLAIIAAVALLRAERGLADVQRQHLEAVVGQWAETMRYGVLARSKALLEPALEAVATTPDLCHVEVLDEEGVAIVSTGRPGASLCPVRVEQAVYTRADLPGARDGELAAYGVTGAEPRLVGRIIATFSTSATTQIQARMRWEIIGAFLLLGTIGVVGVLLLASSVVRRARQLADGAEKVAHGDLDVRLPVQGADELTQLTRRFNAMAESLAAQRRALDQAASQLAEREALAAIGRATAVIAHELKNPLGILLGGAEVAANPSRSQEARQKAAHIIREEVRRLEHTLNELLSYAKPKSPAQAAVDLLALAHKAAERATLEGGPAQDVRVEVSGDPTSAWVDEQHAGQILLNLITNAAQAGATRITVAVSRGGPRAAVDVIDNGLGIDKEIKPQLFRPFVTTKQRGAGLGLAGSRRLARDNGGDLRLAESGAGTRFVLELPLPQESER